MSAVLFLELTKFKKPNYISTAHPFDYQKLNLVFKNLFNSIVKYWNSFSLKKQSNYD
jgi:hypothetical protein